MKASVMLAQFPGNNSTHPDAADWICETYYKAKTDPRFDRVIRWHRSDTPIDMVRNLAFEEAKRQQVDFLLMIDNDMKPDYPGGPGSKPFWDSSIDFIFAKHLAKPCIIAAPYCGPAPYENPYVFKWVDFETHSKNVNIKLECFSREEAASRAGIEQVAALPTGLMILDMRVFNVLQRPIPQGEKRPRHGYCYYEFDPTYSIKESTEDVTLTRDASLAGIPCYCNWDAWAGHWKLKCVQKPEMLTIDNVRLNLQEAIKRRSADEKVHILGAGDKVLPVPDHIRNADAPANG